ncbi:MAG: YciI family protein [Cyclobacteriaceae bacterium]
MKDILLIIIVLATVWSCDSTKKLKTPVAEAVTGYDSLMAAKVGADQYGMRKYVMAFLKAGPERSQSKAEADSIQRAHLNNIKAMAEDGKLVLAGPFMDNSEIRGIYIFAVESIEEAEKLTKTDPAIVSGRLVMDLRPWYGSAGLMKINEIHSQISKISI